MPATHRPAVKPIQRTEAAADHQAPSAHQPATPSGDPMIGRIPLLDIRPLIDCGRRPAKAVVGETFEVSATVFREGHDAVSANVVLRDPAGRSGPLSYPDYRGVRSGLMPTDPRAVLGTGK